MLELNLLQFELAIGFSLPSVVFEKGCFLRLKFGILIFGKFDLLFNLQFGSGILVLICRRRRIWAFLTWSLRRCSLIPALLLSFLLSDFVLPLLNLLIFQDLALVKFLHFSQFLNVLFPLQIHGNINHLLLFSLNLLIKFGYFLWFLLLDFADVVLQIDKFLSHFNLRCNFGSGGNFCI